jgi:uncharacterized membrane protein
LLRRLRAGELLVLVGCCLIAGSLLTYAYSTPVGNLTAWESFGPAVALQLATLFGGLAMIVAALSERESTALPVSTAVWCVLLALLGVIASVVRALERPDHATGTCIGLWLALAGCVLVLLGAWVALRDERTGSYPPPQLTPRPRP